MCKSRGGMEEGKSKIGSFGDNKQLGKILH